MSTIEYLRKRKEELLQLQKEKREREELLKDIKNLEEEGTLKSKLKKGLLSAREHLREKGKKFKETSDKVSKETWSPAITEMSKESKFGTPKTMTQGKLETPLSKRLKK